MKGKLQIEKGTVLKYTGNDEEIKLPRGVVRIAPYAFSGCESLKKVVTPVKLASIGKGAFYGCKNLVEVTLPGRLFRRVNGGKVFPTDADIYFRFYATSGAQSEDEDYSDVFESEEDYVKSGVNDLEHAFSDEVLSEEIITIEEELPPQDDAADMSDLDDRTLQERMDDIVPAETKEDTDSHRQSLVSLSDYLIVGDEVIKYIGTRRVTQVPDFIKKIGENAFSNSDVEKVILPSKLEIIGKNAFAWCAELTEAVVSDGLQMIDDGAFSNCEKLTAVNLPEGLKFIGANAFRACVSLKEIVLPASLSTISRRAFDFCVSVEKVVIPDGIEKIAEGTFSHCESLGKASLPDSLREISAWAFAECYQLREINFPEGLQSIGEVAFMNCRSLVAFDLPQSLKTLGRQAFVGCEALHLVNMPKSLEKQIKPNKVFHKLPNLSINFTDGEIPPAV